MVADTQHKHGHTQWTTNQFVCIALYRQLCHYLLPQSSIVPFGTITHFHAHTHKHTHTPNTATSYIISHLPFRLALDHDDMNKPEMDRFVCSALITHFFKRAILDVKVPTLPPSSTVSECVNELAHFAHYRSNWYFPVVVPVSIK